VSVEIPTSRQSGKITGLERNSCTLDVEGIQGIGAGDRIAVNPSGRGHNYGVLAAEELGSGVTRLTLDVTSVLGHATVTSISDSSIELGFNIMARTGNLVGTRVQQEKGDAWAEILGATNPGRDRTALEVGSSELNGALSEGGWAQVVDYVVGDEIIFERSGLA
jgi:hypothetical protein